jgi:hypothetical protein
MTKGEIIEQLESIIGAYEILMGHGVNSDILGADDIEAIREAIKALNQEPCEDCIRREDALMALTGQCADSPIELLPKAIKRINALPPVTPKQRTGYWVLLRNDNGARSYQCSLCGHWHPLHDHSLGFRYCNWCGAKMQEVKE